MQIWMAIDPETRRVLVSDHPISRDELPRGLRGDDWPQRTTGINGGLLTRMLHGHTKPDTQDRLHQDWWNEARVQGDPLWPLLPDEDSWQPLR